MVDDQSTKQPVMLEGARHWFEILPDDNEFYGDATNSLSVSVILNFNDNSVFFFVSPTPANHRGKGKCCLLNVQTYLL